MGNLAETTTKSRNSASGEWVSQTTKSTYDNKGQLVESYTPRGLKEGYATKYEYDILGRQTKQWNPITKEGEKINTQCVSGSYDTSDNLISEEVQMDENNNAKTEYTYNDKNELVMVTNTVTEKENQYVQYLYDKEGNKVRQFVGMTAPLTFCVTELTEPSSDKQSDIFTYMGVTYEITITGENKKDHVSETKYAYDKKNQLISVTDPEGRTETYAYDIYGNMIKKTEKNGDIINYRYDYQNRLVKETAVSKKTGKKTTHTCEYDDFGNISKQDEKEFTYDNVSDIIVEEASLAGDTMVKKEYTYDSGDNCLSFDVSVNGTKQLSMNYEYDGADRLYRVKADNQGAAEYTYNEDGALASSTAAGVSLTTTYGYNCAGDNTNLSNQLTENSSVISSYQSSYNLNSQKTKETSGVLNEEGNQKKNTDAYMYDRLGRLTEETHTDKAIKNISYTYDSHNNRKEAVYGDTKIGYKYNKNDELYRTDCVNTRTKKDTVTLYKNDKSGNQLATVKRLDLQQDKTTFSLDISLGDNQLHENVVNKYNARNELVSSFAGKNKMTYEYNADGLRTVKKNKKKTTYFIWDRGQIVMELDKDGKVQKRYIRGNNLIYSDTGKGTEPVTFAYNPHGDVVQLLNEKGAVTKLYTYDAFGNEVKPQKKDGNPYRYSGEYYDKETDTLYLRARYYDAGVGRFLTADSYTGEEDDPLSLNLYTYCNNDSVNMTDPGGHWGRDHRYADASIDSYVHMSLTNGAMNMVTSPLILALKGWNYKVLLFGSVLPDYYSKKKKEKTVLNNVLQLKNFSYNSKMLGKYNLKKDSDALHGKSKKEKNRLKKYVLRECKKITYNKDEKFLLMGAALHSIQDYYAHSYVSDLKDYKIKRGKQKYEEKEKGKGKKRSNKDDEKDDGEEKVYHLEWDYFYGADLSNVDKEIREGVRKRNRDYYHAHTKDNPYAYVKKSYNSETGKEVYIWTTSPTKWENKRYTGAWKESREYLKGITY